MNGVPQNNGSELAKVLKDTMDDIAVQTTKEISEFREGLSDKAKLYFDAMPDDKRMIAVGFSRRTRDELAVLTGSRHHFTGLHDFSGALDFVKQEGNQ